jgi:hypothetical protein
MVGSSVAMTMELPVVHCQIIMVTSRGILNLSISLKESFDAIGIPLRLHSGAYIAMETSS